MTAKLRRVPLFGEGIFAGSPVVTRQRRLNCFLEIRKDAEKSSVVCYGTPGLRLAFNAGGPLNTPLRGMIGNDQLFYGVAGAQVSSWSATGGQLLMGTIGSSTGLVGLAPNPTQLLIVDGSAGYIFNRTTGVVTVVGGSFPNGAKSATYCNGFFIAEQPGTNFFWVSNLNDGLTWSGLGFASAVQTIDGIQCTDTVSGLLVVFSSGHIEFWQNAGLTQEPFVYIQNSAVMIGIEAIYSRVHCGDALLFLAHTGGGTFQNSSGSFQICSIQGTTVQVVSSPDVDMILQAMARAGTIQDCTAYSYQIGTHLFAQFNFPTANRSLLLDTTTGFWSEVQTGITSGYAARHIGNVGCGAFGQAYCADWANGNVYVIDPTVYTDNGNTIVREVITRVALEDFNTFRIGGIYLDMQTGVGLPLPASQGYIPLVQLALAKDNRDFGPQRLVELGRQGQYSQRIWTRRWGRARQANLQIRMTDAVPFVITSGAMMTSTRAGRNVSRTRAAA